MITDPIQALPDGLITTMTRDNSDELVTLSQADSAAVFKMLMSELKAANISSYCNTQ